METAVIPGLSRLDEGRKADEPCTIVIFGASGDLTVRKLIPALFHLYNDGQMPEPFRVGKRPMQVGFDSNPMSG